MTSRARRRARLRPAAGLGVLLLLAGCGGAPTAPGPASPTPASSPEATEPAAPAAPTQSAAPTDPVAGPPAAGLADVDLGNLEWVFRPGGNVPETVIVPLADGAATVDGVGYTMGEPVLSDANDDGLLDAAVPLEALDGNAVEEQWYLWIATDDAPVQVTLPIARTASCGTLTRSVTAVDGGFEVHELRRGLSDTARSCAEAGTDERRRTVGAVQARNDGEWWPAQVAPVAAFGGLCPVETNHDAYPDEGPYHVAPDAAATTMAGAASTAVFELEAWPVYGEDFPGWLLVGVLHDGDLSCAWVQPAG